MSDTRYFFKKMSTGESVPIAALMSIGRSEDSTLRLVDGQPSRHHAQVSSDPDNVFVEDLGSTNGTFVNGRRLDARVKLKLTAGDRVRFDTEEFEFIAPGATPRRDADKTVFRTPEPNAADKAIAPRTVVEARRPMAEAPAAQKAPAPEKADLPGKVELPGAFMDPSGKKTVFIDQKRKPVKSSPAPSPALALVDTPCLWVVSGEQAGQKIELKTGAATKGAWSIGSGEDRDVRLQDPGVSAIHATLRNQSGIWQLTDDVSANGTFVNDNKVLNRFLNDGDRVRLGPVECVFRIPPPGDEHAAGSWRKIALIVTAAFLVTLLALFAFMKFL